MSPFKIIYQISNVWVGNFFTKRESNFYILKYEKSWVFEKCSARQESSAWLKCYAASTSLGHSRSVVHANCFVVPVLPFSVPHTLARKNEIHTNKNYLHHLFFIISVSVPHTFARKNEIHTNKDIFIPVVFHLISWYCEHRYLWWYFSKSSPTSWVSKCSKILGQWTWGRCITCVWGVLYRGHQNYMCSTIIPWVDAPHPSFQARSAHLQSFFPEVDSLQWSICDGVRYS